MKYPLVRELSREGIPVTVTCRVLEFSPQGYYKWLREPWSPRDYENAYLTNAAFDAHRDDPAFGYRFISDELEAAGLGVSEPGLASLFGATDLEQFREEEPLWQEARPAGPR
ncbi:MAG: integrase [Acidimicrobiaceae bacterium]|nr:integrase [Acidimicrobiaceae bacterium]